MKLRQQTHTVFMVKPSHFGYNSATAASNVFQHTSSLNQKEISQKVMAEFNEFVATLRAKGINVLVMESSKVQAKPDAVFPNNWISLHQDGSLCLYPMLAKNRQLEREHHIINHLKEHFAVKQIKDFSVHEKTGRIVEGTGSIIFDHPNKIAYACRSERTDESLFNEICEELDYFPIHFNALDENNQSIYHTNVMMAIGEAYALICLECIQDEVERERVVKSMQETGHSIIEISLKQMKAFAGNALEVTNKKGKRFLVLSKSAFTVLEAAQKEIITATAELLPIAVPTIEHIGGGSVRCMIAEIFTPRKYEKQNNLHP